MFLHQPATWLDWMPLVSLMHTHTHTQKMSATKQTGKEGRKEGRKKERKEEKDTRTLLLAPALLEAGAPELTSWLACCVCCGEPPLLLRLRLQRHLLAPLVQQRFAWHCAKPCLCRHLHLALSPLPPCSPPLAGPRTPCPLGCRYPRPSLWSPLCLLLLPSSPPPPPLSSRLLRQFLV